MPEIKRPTFLVERKENRLEFFDYLNTIDIIYSDKNTNKIITNSDLYNTSIYSTPAKYRHNNVSSVDFNVIDMTKFNKETKRWSGSKSPFYKNIIDMLESDEHPLAYIPKEYCEDNGFYYYLTYKIKEGNNRNVDGVEEISTVDSSGVMRFSTMMRKGGNLYYQPLLDFIRKVDYNYYYNVVSPYKNDTTDLIMKDGLNTPKSDNITALVRMATNSYGVGSTYNNDPPSEIEFEDNTEMIKQVYDHLGIDGIKITYLRKRKLTYYGTGTYQTTPDAYPKDSVPEGKKNRYSGASYPIIYYGEAWCLKFTVNGVNHLGNNKIFFATQEQYINAMEKNPKVLARFVEKPWGPLIFISSDWCERNGNRYGGTWQSTPDYRRLTLQGWILGPFIQRCMSYEGSGNPFSKGIDQTSSMESKGKWRSLRESRDKIDAYANGLNKFVQDIVEDKDNILDNPVKEEVLI